MGGSDLARGLELADVFRVVLLDLGIGRGRRKILRAQGHVLHAAAVGLTELVGVLGQIGGELGVGGVGAGDDRRQLDEGPRRAHFLAPQAEGLLELGLRHLDAVPDRGFDLRARHLAAEIGLEPGSAPLEVVLVPLEHEAAVLLERGDRVNPRVQLLVADREPFGIRPLDDQRLLDEIADHLLRQAQALRHFRREALAVDLRVCLEVRLIAPLEALDRDLLAVDRRHRIARLAVAVTRPGRAEHEQRGDERRDDDQQADLQRLPVAPHHRDHQRSPSSGC